jgi:hypothetical protein
MPSKSFAKVIGLLLLLSLGPLTIYILYQRTGGLESRRELAFHRNIRFAFMAGTDTVDLEPLTDWPWVTVCAFKGGLKQEEIDGLVGFSYENFSHLTWRYLDDHWTLLFIDSERETNWGRHRPIIPIRIPKDSIADYDFIDGKVGSCANRNAAVLSLTKKTVPLGVTPIVAQLAMQTPRTE